MLQYVKSVSMLVIAFHGYRKCSQWSVTESTTGLHIAAHRKAQGHFAFRWPLPWGRVLKYGFESQIDFILLFRVSVKGTASTPANTQHPSSLQHRICGALSRKRFVAPSHLWRFKYIKKIAIIFGRAYSYRYPMKVFFGEKMTITLI